MFKSILILNKTVTLKLDELNLLKITRFILSGSTAAAVNLFTLFLLVQFAHIYYLTASIIAVLTSMIVSFLLQKFWTFQNKDTRQAHVQFMKFAIVGSINLGINTGLMYLFVSILGIWYLAAQVIAAIMIAFISYFSYKIIVFSQ